MALRGELQMAVSSSNRRTRAHGSQFLRAQVVSNMVKYFILRSDDPPFLVYMGGGYGKDKTAIRDSESVDLPGSAASLGNLWQT